MQAQPAPSTWAIDSACTEERKEQQQRQAHPVVLLHLINNLVQMRGHLHTATGFKGVTPSTQLARQQNGTHQQGVTSRGHWPTRWEQCIV